MYESSNQIRGREQEASGHRLETERRDSIRELIAEIQSDRREQAADMRDAAYSSLDNNADPGVYVVNGMVFACAYAM